MKTIFYSLIFLLAINCLQGSAQPVEVTRSQEKTLINGVLYYIHTVQKGQTLFSISKAYGVAQADVIQANPGLDPTAIREGQALRIPVQPVQTTATYPENKDDFYAHRVRRGQTIYSIARKYDVDVPLIYYYNPWAKQGIRPNETIWIPRKEEMRKIPLPGENSDGIFFHTVKEDETLFGISQQYGVSVKDITLNNTIPENGIKPGMVLKIPRIIEKPEENRPLEDSLSLITGPCSPLTTENTPLNIALMLPFYAKNIADQMMAPDSVGDEGGIAYSQRQIGLRGRSFVEFYEGFLLAVDSLKRTGLSVNLHVFDTEHDTSHLHQIIKNLSLINPDLIIGPVYSEDVNLVGRLAQNKGVNLVSPLSARASLLANNPRIFQVIPSREAENEKLADYLSRIKRGKFILIRGTDSISMRESWLFKQYFTAHLPLDSDGIPLEFRDYPLSDTLLMNLDKVLSQNDTNLVIVYSESEPNVGRLINKLYMMSDLYPINLFGMPSWQVWRTIDLNYLFSLHLQLISPFYADYNNPAVKRFLYRCRQTYGFEPYEISTRGYNFGMLGYDIGLYFLKALREYGPNFQQCITQFDDDLLLSPYHFLPYGNGGYMNQGFNIIRYNPDLTVTRTLIR